MKRTEDPVSIRELDFSLSPSVLHLHQIKPKGGQLQRFRCTICGLKFLLSKFFLRLQCSRKSAAVWNHLNPVRLPTPLLPQLVDALTVWLGFYRKPKSTAFAVPLGLFASLPAENIIGLRISDILYTGDPLLAKYYSDPRAGCVKRLEKSSDNQFALLYNRLLHLLRRWLSPRRS